MDFLQHYENVYVQKINKAKSDIYLGKRASARHIESASCLVLKSLHLPIGGAYYKRQEESYIL